MNRTPFLFAGLILAIAVTMWPPPSYTTNCGGNSAALNRVITIANIARHGLLDTPDQTFRFATANAQERELLSQLSHDHWVHKAHFLVTTAPISENEPQSHRILVVCDTPYRNVPEQRFGSAPPTHAAAFADGTYGLISTAEFAALDRSTFLPLDELYPLASK